MHLNLSPEMEQYLQSKVASGDYSNASEVVRDAIRRMKEVESGSSRLRTAVQKGIDSFEKDGSILYSKKLMDKIFRDAIKRVKSGEHIDYDPDVVGPGDDEPWGGKLS